MSSSKENKVKLKHLLSWQKANVLGHKTEVKEGVTSINYVWCKVCARNEHVIKSDKSCKWELKFPQRHKALYIMKQNMHTTKSIRIKNIAHENFIYNIKAK